MAGLQSGEGRMMVHSVVWAQYINVTDTQTATSPYSNSRRNALRSCKKRVSVAFHYADKSRTWSETSCELVSLVT